MRIVQAIQAFAAFAAAIVITFLQPQRDVIGVGFIGVLGLLVVSVFAAISHVVAAFVIGTKNAAIFNTGVVLLLGIQIAAQVGSLLDKNAKENLPIIFHYLAASWLVVGGLAIIGVAHLYRKTSRSYKDNTITAVIFLVPGLVIALIPTDLVTKVGLLNFSMIFAAVHLAISAASKESSSTQLPKALG
jgi:uncharacterized membrane protein YjjB (DUF3815 family)